MLLLDDDDELPACPTDGEIALTDSLGTVGLMSVDDAIRSAAQPRWLKVARVVIDAMRARGLQTEDEQVQLHVRRVVALVESGVLEAQGNLRRPRFCEVRLPVR